MKGRRARYNSLEVCQDVREALCVFEETAGHDADSAVASCTTCARRRMELVIDSSGGHEVAKVLAQD